MKVKMLILAFVCCLTMVSAQENKFAFGLKAGLSTTALQEHKLEVSGDGVSNLLGTIKAADYGFQGGLFFRIPLGERLFLQPEATFNSSQANFRFEDINNNDVTVLKETYNHLDVPLLFGYSLGILKLQAGPVGHFYFDESNQVFSSEGWESAFDEFNLGYALGGALDIGPVTLDVRYDGNFSRFGQTISIGDQKFAVDQAAKRWVATLGWRF